ncbi:hypothetical protein GF336_00250 [Candidatus Woesearchaeota archaeon]|nr:hypothetical protein [Candidatus Woesearchaeota archaeon]
MKEQEFEKKDGSKGVKYILQAGDKVTSRFAEPRKADIGKFPSYSLGVTTDDGKEVYVQLTEGQFKRLHGKDLTGKTIVAEEYENEFGKQIGVKVE